MGRARDFGTWAEPGPPEASVAAVAFQSAALPGVPEGKPLRGRPGWGREAGDRSWPAWGFPHFLQVWSGANGALSTRRCVLSCPRVLVCVCAPCPGKKSSSVQTRRWQKVSRCWPLAWDLLSWRPHSRAWRWQSLRARRTWAVGGAFRVGEAPRLLGPGSHVDRLVLARFSRGLVAKAGIGPISLFAHLSLIGLPGPGKHPALKTHATESRASSVWSSPSFPSD